MQLGGWRNVLASAMLAAGLLGSGGCMTFFNAVHSPADELVEPCKELPQACRSHVYIFIVNGMDPCNWSNLSGLRDYLNEIGFTKTYSGELYHASYFDKEVHQLHKDDPDAHFVLIGFSFGANVVRDIAHSAKKDDIAIDLLVYLGGNTLKNCEKDKPDNALQILNILANGFIWNGDMLEGAENVQVPGCWHFGSACHPQTLDLLTRSLAVVAARVPVVCQAEPKPLFPEDAPTPRPVQRHVATSERDEWDFLKPAQQLKPPSQGSRADLSVGHKGAEEAQRPRWIRGQIAPGMQNH